MTNRCLSPTCLVLALLVAAACAPAPSPTAVVPALATALPTETAAPTRTTSPRPTVAPSASPTAVPRPTATLPPPLKPLTSAYFLWFEGWSPDSRWLAYRTVTPEEARQNPYEGTSVLPYGTFHFWDPITGAGCAYATDNPFGLQPNLWRDWLPDGRLMTLGRGGEVVVLEQPCAGDTAAPLTGAARPRCLVTNPDSGQSCSPDGTRLGHSDETRDPRTTTILNTVTGEVEAVITWPPAWDGVGHLGGPAWLDNEHFILQATHAGPLLVTLGEVVQVEHIAPAYFGIPGNHGQTASAAQASGSADFLLLLQQNAHDGADLQAWLYHPESGLVEAFPGVYALFWPGGRWLVLRDDDADPAWLRPIDPPFGQPREWLAQQSEASAGLSPDLARVAVAQPSGLDGPGRLSLYARATGALLQTYSFGEYSPSVPAWSPNLRYLALVGYRTAAEPALFVISVLD